MTTPSPDLLAGSTISLSITANGQPLDNSWQVVSVDVRAGVNRLPQARIVIADGSPSSSDFPISESAALIPGAALTIALGYGSHNEQVFSGLVYRQGLEISENGPSHLIVEATDKAMAMTLARNNAVFENMTDSDMIKQLIGRSGLSAAVTATSVVQPAIVQYYATDWDMMLLRAQVNGMVVIASAGAVTVGPPDTSVAPVLSLTYGQSILGFRATMDASTQYAASAIQSFAWSPATQAVTASGSANASVSTPGNLSSDQLAQVFGIARYPQQSAGTLETADLTGWSSAELARTRLAKIRGEVRFRGSSLARPGCMVTLAGLGDRFNGDAYVSGMHHEVADGQWHTTVEIGLSPQSVAVTAPGIAAPGASGQLPPVANLQTGVVRKIDSDPDGEFRVQVILPLLQAGTQGVWARLGSLYASNGIGAVFYPEVGDEVVVAFMNGDPRFPVIIGSLYSKKNPPPVSPDASNSRKSIITRSGARIDFSEAEPAMEISTPGGQRVRLDDKAGSVTIRDRNGSTVTMASDGVTIDSAGKIMLNARTDIAIAAQGKLSLSGTAGVAIAGPTIRADADTSFTAQGSAEATLVSGGMVTIQGGMVKIN
jgi:Rhs element Vgr protein